MCDVRVPVASSSVGRNQSEISRVDTAYGKGAKPRNSTNFNPRFFAETPNNLKNGDSNGGMTPNGIQEGVAEAFGTVEISVLKYLLLIKINKCASLLLSSWHAFLKVHRYLSQLEAEKLLL